MSWSTVSAKIVWYDQQSPAWTTYPNFPLSTVSSTDQTTISNALEDVYLHSPNNAQAMLDGWAANNYSINIGTLAVGGVGKAQLGDPSTGSLLAPSSRYVGYDLIGEQQLKYINAQGQVVSDKLSLTVIHELAHIMLPSIDPPWRPNQESLDAFLNRTADQNGATLDFQNAVAVEMHLDSYVQINYFSSFGASTAIDTALQGSNFSYTEGNTINAVRLGDLYTSANNMDQSDRTGSIDLMLGLSGNDTLLAGDGNDYLYGGAGSDTLSGGSGNDLIDGADVKNPGADSVDTVDFSIGDHHQATPGGITAVFDFTTTTQIDGRQVFTVSNDGYGNSDRLVSIEVVKGTAHDDTFQFKGATASGLQLTIDGNGASSHDILDFSQSAQSYQISVDASGSGSAQATSSPGSVSLVNITPSIIGSAGNDAILAARANSLIDGGAGNDLIQARSATATTLGGDGSDRILVFGGATVDGGAGNDIYKIEGAPGTIRFGAGSGNEVVEGNAIIDFGTLSMSAVSLAWNYSTSGVEDLDPETGIWHKQYDGAVELVLSSGDSIRILGDTLHAWTVAAEPGGSYSDAFVNLSLDLSFSEFKFADGTVNLWDLLWDTGFFGDTTVDLGSGQTYTSTTVAKPLAGTTVHDAPNDLAWVSDFFGHSPVAPTGPNDQAYASAGDDLFYQGGASYDGSGSQVTVSLRSNGLTQQTGGSGHDILVDVTEVDGSAYADTLTAGYTATTVHGGDGDDLILNAGLSGFDAGSELFGDAGDDTFSLTVKGNVIDGGSGSDTVQFDLALSQYVFLRTADGGIQVIAGDAMDTIHTVEWASFADVTTPVAIDSLVSDYGTEGDDPLLSGTDGRDSLFGLGGDDTLLPGAGMDYVDGGAGEDQVNYLGDSTDFSFLRNADGSVSVSYDAGGAIEDRGILANVEAVYFEGDSQWHSIVQLAGDYGTGDNDAWLQGTSGADNLYGLAGDDVLIGYQGNDLIDGGDGYDQVNYDGDLSGFTFVRNADGSVTVTDTAGNEGADTVFSADAFYFNGSSDWRASNEVVADYGTADSDPWISGTEGTDNVYGLAGDDTLVGNGGNDQLFGGDGYDQANYFGSSSQYTFALNSDGSVTVTDTVGGEGVDILHDVESLYFQGDDTWMTLDDALGGSSAASRSAGGSQFHDEGWAAIHAMFGLAPENAFVHEYVYS